MDYEGTGFFHCFDETPSPSTAPSNSLLPSSTPSIAPTRFNCEAITTKKECIKQSESCIWDNEKDICNDAASLFPTFSPTSMFLPNTPFPMETGGVNCPQASDVGCTAFDPSDPKDECSTIGEPCQGNAGEFCCRDGCPRNYCTAKITPFPTETEGATNALVIAEDDTISLEAGATEAFIAVLENDAGSNLIIRSIPSQPTNGQCSVSLNLSEVVYIPNDTSVVGSDQCTYETCDDEEVCDTAIVRINIG